jgi:low-affinity ferrous iron transport protein
MEQAFRILRAPGARREFVCAAPTQVVVNRETDQEKPIDLSVDNINTYSAIQKVGRMDVWFDKVVEASGSGFIYFTTIVALLTWAFLGIPFGESSTWKIVISNAQAIINMVFDAFLMRQQLNSHQSLMMVAASLRSRANSHKRMLNKLMQSGRYSIVKSTQFQEIQQTDFATKLPSEDWLGRFSTACAAFLGHIATVFSFWICIFIWIGFGKYCNWSDTWQLYINSATSALMVFMLAFLANIRKRHTEYMAKCLEAIWQVDTALEVKLRTATGDNTENPAVTIHAPKRGRIQRAIDYYADLVGTLTGIVILVFVIIVWVAIGPVLHFDATWWLLIGTYAGLIGLNDGFVLRNICTVLGNYEDQQFTEVDYGDMDMLTVIGVEKVEEERVADNSLTCRISIRLGDVCSHELSVVLGVITILGLLIGASAMEWSFTGQLLCNVPPSIIESFFTMILLTGHNIGDAKRRIDLFNIYLRRLKLVSYIDGLPKVDVVEQIDEAEQVDETEQVNKAEQEIESI